MPHNNLHVQLIPCSTQENQSDTNKTSVWVPGGCPESGAVERTTDRLWHTSRGIRQIRFSLIARVLVSRRLNFSSVRPLGAEQYDAGAQGQCLRRLRAASPLQQPLSFGRDKSQGRERATESHAVPPAYIRCRKSSDLLNEL